MNSTSAAADQTEKAAKRVKGVVALAIDIRHGFSYPLFMSYTTQELYECIFECMSESLPENWESASVHATIHGSDVKSVFHYLEEGSNREMEYTPENFVAPLNALVELQKLAAVGGRPWSTIDLHINRKGQVKLAIR